MATKTSSKKSTSAKSGRKTVAINGRNYKEGSSRANAALAAGGKASTDRSTIHSNSDALRSRISARENGVPDYTAPDVLTSGDLTTTPAFNLPEPPAPSNSGLSAMLQMSGLANAKDTATTTSSPSTPPKPGSTNFSDMAFADYIKEIKKPPSMENIYQDAEEDAGVQEKQKLVNTYQNQLNAIVAKAQADKLSLIGQGRGVTEAIIGGQQAQIDREAAIQSLPIAAQLTAAQGDLEMAKSHLETLFSIRKEDALAKYNHKTKLAETIFNYADSKQKLALQEKTKNEDRAFTLMTNNLNYAQTLAAKAIDNGQPSTAARIMAIDPNLPGYQQKLAEAAKSIYVEQKTSGSTGTLEERQAGAVGELQDLLQRNEPLPNNNLPVDENGYLTPEAWKFFVSRAPAQGLTRAKFIENFGNYVYNDTKGGIPASYGLTPSEKKIILGELP